MLRVGRRRTKDLHCPAGVRERGGVWYWEPTSKREREERRRNRELTGEPIGITLGPAGSKAARKRWAEVSGHREEELAANGTVAELVTTWRDEAIKKKPGGKPRSKATVRSYQAAIPLVLKRVGAAHYGKTDFEASRGRAIGSADIQNFVAEHPSPSVANICLAVLANSFNYGIRRGRTTYNPCDKVVKNDLDGRKRELQEWEVEVLATLARSLLRLILDYVVITGDRINEILAIAIADLMPHGIRVTRKGGKVEVWEWTPELRRIVAEAAKLPGATPFPKSPLFPGRRGKPFTYTGFNAAWQALKRKANEHLREGIIDPDSLERVGRLAITNLHFHDSRAKVHDDAEDAGLSGHQQIGDTRKVAERHYARREKRKTPLK